MCSQFVGVLGEEGKPKPKVLNRIDQLKKEIGRCVKKFQQFAPAGFEFTVSNHPHICFLSQDRTTFSIHSINSDVTVKAKTGTVKNCVCGSVRDLEEVLAVCNQLIHEFN